MGQYDELVKKQRLMLKAEAWAKEIKYILADSEVFKVAYNDGSTKIETSAGTTYTDAELSLEDCITRMKELEADAQQR